MPQTSITARMGAGYAGQIAEALAPKYAYSAVCEAALSAGTPVKRGTATEYQVEPFEAADVPDAGMFAGIVLLNTTNSPGAFAIGDPCSVMRLGKVLMSFSEAVNAGEQVGLTLASGVLTGIPQGTAAGAITTGIVVLPGLRIARTTTAAGVAAVEVNLFGAQDAATVGSL